MTQIPVATQTADTDPPPRKPLASLAFASIGVVFGDIGTSPLYAMRESLHPVVAAGGNIETAVLGIISLLLWALFLIVMLKYVVLIMRADNKGEGGILSLVALLETILKRRSNFVLALGIMGAAFFFGDAMITPAISVLSAMEGLNVIDPHFEHFVVPGTISVLVTLFLFQYRGTAGIASFFAPVTIVWFAIIGIMGLVHIGDDPHILYALNPYHGVSLLIDNPKLALVVCGGVFLAVTGGEALYADMGHFGKTPIRLAWFCVVFPSLILNYLGQGAFIITHPEAVSNPFFLMAPEWALVPLVVLATAVTVIASQAVITGAFSIAQQATSLGLLPRMGISHTSETEQGQIYISQINWLILAGVIILVLTFKSSTNLAAAYGIAVNVSMLTITPLAVIFFWHMRSLWRYAIIAMFAVIFVIEATFFFANALKLLHGAYMPVIIGCLIITMMLTWRRGRKSLSIQLQRDSANLNDLLSSLEHRPPTRVHGAAIFLQTDPSYAPSALMHNLKHNRILHEKLVFIYIGTSNEPRVAASQRVSIDRLPLDAWMIKAYFGYMEQPDVPMVLNACKSYGLNIDPRQVSYFLGRRSIKISNRSQMPLWQQRLFIMLANQSARSIEFFRIPPDRVVELGMQMSV